jgi:hypothetical protein
MSETLLAFKAGRAFRREGTNIVEPSPTKGAIILSNGDDGLLHFIWKNRTTNDVEEVCAIDIAIFFKDQVPYVVGCVGFDFIPVRCYFCESLSVSVE